MGEEIFSVWDALQHQWTFMTKSMCATSLPWRNRRSLILGMSCLCYLFPAVYVCVKGKLKSTIAWILQAVVSFLSDFVYSGVNSVSHALDRWLAVGMTLYMVWLAYTAISTAFALTVLLPLTCMFFSKRAIHVSFEHYVMWHTLWHVTGSALVVSTYYNMNK